MRRRWVQRLMLGVPALAFMCAAARSVPPEPISWRSEASQFTVRVTGIERPESVNRLHGFDLSLATADGKPATGASIVLTGQRRYSSNPLPTSPQVSSGPRDGTYRIEGLRFHMPGEWRLVFEIQFEQISDRAAIEIVVK